jgi:hypothetical protein
MKATIFTSSKSQATDYYRTIGPFSRLALQKKFELIICSQEKAVWHDIYNTDIVIIQRPNSTASLGIMADAKRMGKAVIIDFDDHLLDVPEDNPASHYFSNPQVQKQIADTFLFADAVIVSTKKLYDLYHPMCQGKIPMFVIPNGWNPSDLPMFEAKPQHKPTRFVWRGGSTHFADLHTVKAEINEMLEMDTEVTFFGLTKFMMYDLNKKAINVDWSSMFVYFTFMQRIEGDFGFYPLVRNDFNLSKSNIFAIECLANGMPVLADNYFPEFNMPGVIKYTNPAQFLEFVTDIVKGNINKADYVKAGRTYIRETLHIDLLNRKRWEILKGI